MNEIQELGVIQETLAGRMTVKTAAGILQRSERQIYRLRQRIRKNGPQAIAHGNRGKLPAHARTAAEREHVVTLYKTTYKGYNFTHFAEALQKEQGIALSDETVRRWLRREGEGGTIRKTRQHRKRRLRKAREGEMLFLDGSPHHWFGDDHPPCTLLLCCDDATGKPLGGLFREQEDRDGCFLLLAKIFKKDGLPQSFYLDRASQFKTTRHGGIHSRQCADEPTAFQRAMAELGIQVIFSYSPQARGRIERLNGVFQDRLVSELRRHGIHTLDEANRYLARHFLPAYAKRFGIAPRDPRAAWRPVPPDRDLFDVLCVKERRTVANDNTLSYRGKIYQLLPTPHRRHFVKARVEVRQRPDGKIKIVHPQAGVLPFRPCHEKPS